MPSALESGFLKTLNPYTCPMHMCTAIAAGGTSQRLNPARASVAARPNHLSAENPIRPPMLRTTTPHVSKKTPASRQQSGSTSTQHPPSLRHSSSCLGNGGLTVGLSMMPNVKSLNMIDLTAACYALCTAIPKPAPYGKLNLMTL